ncbi:MAG: type II CRISPR-associated endonuclease Cas1 [Candidatus Krumholzibacteriota bacterium]|nr:type II CRISPR-associated endonuclease Cas1 [Candidatus Krumholzibacteriota bacterium]
MTDRILDFSREGAFLHLRQANLIIERREQDEVSVPLSDLGVVVVSHPQVSLSKSLLSAMVENGSAFVVCDEKHLPVGMLLPLQANSVQTERLAQQTRASLPTKKRLWQQLVREKILAQGRLLESLHGKDYGVGLMAKRVQSGDPANMEAQAARRYWAHFFGQDGFRRNPGGEGLNSLLNYGYAILRAMVARAVAATGLHPSIGLHHHNRYNAFCLADDLMEPYRPLVDHAAYQLTKEKGEDVSLSQESKGRLLSALTGRYSADGEERTLFDWFSKCASSLNAVFKEERKELFLPRFTPQPDNRSLED